MNILYIYLLQGYICQFNTLVYITFFSSLKKFLFILLYRYSSLFIDEIFCLISSYLVYLDEKNILISPTLVFSLINMKYTNWGVRFCCSPVNILIDNLNSFIAAYCYYKLLYCISVGVRI